MRQHLARLRTTLLLGRIRTTGFIFLSILLTWPFILSQALSERLPLYQVWFALEFFLLAPLYLLLASSLLHELKRLSLSHDWKISKWDGPISLTLLTGFTIVLSIAVSVLLLPDSYPFLGLPSWFLQTPIPIIIACWLFQLGDQLCNRQFTFVPLGFVATTTLLVAVAVEWIACGEWGNTQIALHTTLTALVSGLATALVFAALYLVGLFWVARSSTSQPKTSPTRGLQFRYMKAMVAFTFSAAIIYFLTHKVAASLSLDASVSFDTILGTAQRGAIKARAESLSDTYLAGLTWVIALPLIILTFTLIGLLYVQDVSRDRCTRKTKHSREVGNGKGTPRILVECALEDLSVAVALITSTVQRIPLPVSIGLALNVLFSLSPAFYSDAKPLFSIGVTPDASNLVNPFILLNIWIGSLLLWAGPLVASITDLHGSLTHSIGVNVNRSLSRAEEHVVIVGYGDLARRVVKDLFKRRILDIAYERDCWDLVMPNGARAALLQGIVAIDINPEAFAIARRVGGALEGIIRLDDDPFDTGPTPAFGTYILGVCGDANQRQVLEYARVNYAANIICLARDSNVAYGLSDYLKSNSKRKAVPAILATQGNSARAYLSYRAVDTPVSFVHLAHSRSAVLAQTIADALETSEENSRENKLLILGSSREALCLLDCILKVTGTRSGSTLGKVVCIQTDSNFLDSQASPPIRKGKWKGWRRVDFARQVGDLGQVGRPRAGVKAQSFKVYWMQRSTNSEFSISKTLTRIKPSLVVVTEPGASQQLRVLRKVVRSARQHEIAGSENGIHSTLKLIVAIETGLPGRANNAGDAVSYFYNSQRAPDKNPKPATTKTFGFRYPRQFGFSDHKNHNITGDLAVDVLEDPANRIVSTLHSHRRDSAVELSMCLHSYPGALASLVCMTAGLKAPPVRKEFRGLERPSLVGTRMFTGRSGKQYMTSSARLREGSTIPILAHTPVCRASFLPLGVVNAMEQLECIIPGLVRDSELNTDPESWWCKDCPDMTSCPVATQQKTAIARMSPTNTDTSPFCWFGIPGLPSGFPNRVPATESTPARLVCAMARPDESGVGASVLAFLALTKAEARYTDPDPNARKQPILNFLHVMDEPCHNQDYSVVSMKGNIELWTPNALNKAREAASLREEVPQGCPPMTDLLIRPIGDVNRWASYGRSLATVAKQGFGVEDNSWSLVRVSVCGMAIPSTEEDTIMIWLRFGSSRIALVSGQQDRIHRALQGMARCDVCVGGDVCPICRELNAALGSIESEQDGLQICIEPM